jgi:hypothetical protein
VAAAGGAGGAESRASGGGAQASRDTERDLDASIERTGRRRRPRGEFRAEIGTVYGPVVEDPATAREDEWAVLKSVPRDPTDETPLEDLTADAEEERSVSHSRRRARRQGSSAVPWGTVALWVAGAVIVAVALFL